jgi:hypothetical protein
MKGDRTGLAEMVNPAHYGRESGVDVNRIPGKLATSYGLIVSVALRTNNHEDKL